MNPTYYSMTFKEEIQTRLLQPNYMMEIREFLTRRTCWRKAGIGFETTSKVLVGIGSVVSFSAGVYGSTTLSFVAGSISTLSLVMLQLSSYSYRESKEATEELNITLNTLGIPIVPEVLHDSVEKEKENELKEVKN